MAKLNGVVLTDDEAFRTHVTALLRTSPVPITPVSESGGRDGYRADILVIDARADLDRAMARSESWRASNPAGVFAVASDCAPDLILRAMRSGANEFFAWPLPENTFFEAVQRASTRVAATVGTPASRTIVFIGAKGGAGTTTV